jgi:signal transduction histidine kinase/CheY-like chemotaxis protein
MSARQPLAAGVIVVSLATAVLIGWLFDITMAKSVMAGWRVMVPATAASFVLLAMALIFAAGHRDDAPNVGAARSFALFALALPLITFIEYVTGIRTGIENWFGVRFDATSDVAGRMSPLTSVCFVALALAVAAGTDSRPRAIAMSRVASGSTLLTSWLAMVVIAFDSGRIADVPRFPGMAVLTIALMAVTSWGALGLTFDREPFATAAGTRAARAPLLVAIAFVVPLLLGWVRDLTHSRVPQQVLTAIMVSMLTATLATIIWQYASRMALLRRDRERALAELERRVDERTRELASRNAELRLSEDRLRDADRRKDEFLATLAHELRNPLAPIRNAVAVLRADHVSEGDRVDARTIIDRQVSHMVRLIDDLLDVSRITAGKLPMRKTHLQLNEVIKLAVATVQPHLDQARHRLTINLPREPITIDGDESRLSQVFANLLHNACKYTEPGGEIAITAWMPKETEVAISVRDNGIGIPEDFVPRLFEKFSQVAPALDRSQGGLGLGLSLVQGIVFAHGGRVEARSAGAGRGSEFIVHLPAAKLPAARAVVNGLGAARGDHISRRVMVVDDNADSAESMAMLLRINGHLVETAHDGEEALEVAERFQPDAMLLDLGMPKLNGFEVCRRIRATAWGGSVLMIAQTGWGQAQDRARTLEAGFDAHLTKPIDPDAVNEMLVGLKGV